MAGYENVTEDKLQVVAEILPATATEAITRAEVDVQIATAHAYPRSIKRSQDRAREMATLDAEVASECFYKLPREGKKIEGPSIRLAEICAAAWGNLRIAARIVGDDGKFVTAQGMCHDLENNVAVSSEVRRRVTGKNGNRYSDDMVVMTMNAACAIARRNTILQVIPGALVKPIYDAAKKTAIGDAKTMAARRDDIVKAFAKMSVDEAMIERSIGHRVEEITFDDIEDLRGAYNAIRDGMASVDDLFPVNGKATDERSRTDSLADRLRARRDGETTPEPATASTSTSTEAVSEPADVEQPETLPEQEKPVEKPKTQKPISLNKQIMDAITSKGLSPADVKKFQMVVTDGKPWVECDDEKKTRFLTQITL